MQSAYPVFPFGHDSLALEFPTLKRLAVAIHDHFIPHARNNYHPHAISHRMLGLLSILVVTVKIAGIAVIALAPALPAHALDITSYNVVELTNSARESAGLHDLTYSPVLAKAAQNKANDMLAKQYFSHNTPSGATPWSFIKAVGYNYLSAGENLAIDFSEAESIQTAWMNSPGHRANILNGTFQEIGVGIASGIYNGHNTTIVVQMFGTPIAQQVNLSTTPTEVEGGSKISSEPVSQSSHVTEAGSAESAGSAENNSIEVSYASAIQIKTAETALQGSMLYLNVATSDNVTKVLASYNNQNLLLDPAENNQWYGYIPLEKLNPYSNLSISAYDIKGEVLTKSIAQFDEKFALGSTNVTGTVEGASIEVFGKTISIQYLEEKILLAIIIGLLVCLLLAIAVKRHVQHVSLVANTAFVAMLAVFMLLL